jgi:DNA-binding transcriptional LysR family regulator
MRIECTLASACLQFVAEGAGISIVDNISAWKMRHAVEFRPFTPQLEIELSLYRPWGTPQSAICNAFTEHLVRRVKEISKKAAGG